MVTAGDFRNGVTFEMDGAVYSIIEVRHGRVAGIRISTRPDAIDREVLDILKRYGVTSVELGAQSMRDEVLEMNRRSA